MKIAQLISSYFPQVGGAEVCIHNICQRLARKGHQVVLVTPSLPKAFKVPYETVQIPWPIAVLAFRGIPFARSGFRLFLKHLQRRYEFDLWQVTIGYPFGVLAVACLKSQNLPCILRCSGEDIQKDQKLSYGYRLNRNAEAKIKETYPMFDLLVANSPSMSDEYRKLKIPEEKIVLIPNGVDFVRFRSVPRTDFLRKRYKIAAEKKILLTVGRNHPKKGFDLIPLVIEKLLKWRTDFIWLIVGPGTRQLLKVAIPEEVRGYLIVEEHPGQIEEQWEFPPNSLIQYYINSDVFVFPSRLETFGIVLVEAMAAGIPVVTTSAPGCRDVVTDGVTGLLAPVEDAESLALHINNVLGNCILRRRLVQNGLDLAGKSDWNVRTGQYMEMYQMLVERKRELI